MKRTRLGTGILLLATMLSADAMAQKDSDIRVSRGDRRTLSSGRPQIAASGDSVYVTWQDFRSRTLDIYFNRSLDGGASWLPGDIRVCTGPTGFFDAIRPQIAASGNSVYVAWDDFRAVGGAKPRIYFSRSLDGGTTWPRSNIRVDRNPNEGSVAFDTQIAASGDAVYVTWQDSRDGKPDIYVNCSLDNGLTWLASDIRLDTDPAGAAASTDPQIAASNGSIYVTWVDIRNGRHDIYFNRSLDDGLTWLAADTRLDTSLPGSTKSASPQIAAADSSVFVVWSDTRNGRKDIYFSRSVDRGATWLASDLRLDTDVGGVAKSDLPQITVSGDSVYVVWTDTRNGGVDIYFNRSLDGGTTWLGSDIRMGSGLFGTASSEGAQIAAFDNSVYVTWSDFRNGRSDVYFNRSLDGGTTWLPSEIRLDTDVAGAASSDSPAIAASSDSAYVVWEETRNLWLPSFYGDIYFNIPFGTQPYGKGTPGTGDFTPRLSGTNSVNIGKTFQLMVSDGLGGAFGVLAMGPPNSQVSIPLAGGSLLISPITRVRLIQLDGTASVPGTGTFSIELRVPAINSLLGSQVNFQAAFLDPGADSGLSLTNGVEAWIL